MVRDEGQGRINAFRLISDLCSRGDNLVTWLTERRRWLFGVVSPSDVRVVRLRLQASQIRGIDMVFSKLKREFYAIDTDRRAPLDVDAMCRFALEAGAVNRMRALAVEFRAKYRTGRVVRYMTALEAALDKLQSMEDERLTAVAMALHHRLGSASHLACLGRDILPHCVPRSEEAPLVAWRDVAVGVGLL